MQTRTAVDISSLSLPREIAEWVDGARLYESSGWSGAKTVFVERDKGAYLKIAEAGRLARLAGMQRCFHQNGLSSEVLLYLSADRDYLITAPVAGESGIAEKYLAEPARLSKIFGESLRRLHDAPPAGAPDYDVTCELTENLAAACFSQSHLDLVAPFFGKISADSAACEIAEKKHLLKSDAILHGDYCLPNIMLDDWKFSGFIDIGEGGRGDRHYDICWGLWTIMFNLKSAEYGENFLDSYGRDAIDPERLRICALLTAIE